MKKIWEVTAKGKVHTIVYETGAVAKVTVDGKEEKLKSRSPWLNLIDHEIWFGRMNLHLVVVGKKVDLAVDGTYRESGEKYVPLNPVPRVINMLVILNVVGGFFLGGFLCALLGILFGTIYTKAAIRGGKVPMYMAFVLCVLIQAAWYAVAKSV